MRRLVFILCTLLLSANTGAADSCDTKIQRDLRVTEQAIGVFENGQFSAEPRYQIRQSGELVINGDAVKLNRTQRQAAVQFAGEMAALATRWIALSDSALELAAESLDSALSGALGEDNNVVTSTNQAMQQARQLFEQRSMPSAGVYQLHTTDYNDLGETLEDELEDAGSQVTSALLAEIGDILRSDDLTFKQKMQAFGENMRRVGEEIGHTAHALEETGRELCANAREVRQLEVELLREIPALEDYKIFK